MSETPRLHPVLVASLLGFACRDAGDDTGVLLPELGDLVQVVPGDGLPDEVEVQTSNNNLDVVEHDGQVFFAFRTAPDHFASEQTRLHVVSGTDQQTWNWQLTLHESTDLREPRFLSLGDRLLMYYAVLGTDPTDFEPQGTRVTVLEDGTWSEPAWIFEDGFIPWRARVVDGVPMMIGYSGGEQIYDASDELPRIEVRWLTTGDGLSWEGVVPDQEVVHVGGGSETDFAFAPDGAVIAVMRNEAGDADGWGSKICRGEPGALADWTCEHDPRRYDSPLVFAHDGRIWLIGRRNVTETGHYDLERRDLSHGQQTTAYSLDYWQQPKRCSVWEVDPVELEVSWVLDLPSRGDTCFPSILPAGSSSYEVYNYSSDPDGDDVSWLEGQVAETRIYRQELRFPI
ncbi:MAG: hypothetical protein QGG40_15515 [Myxococcota bacterium]|nr:hypothetical protein [Myxococcota bacterium]